MNFDHDNERAADLHAAADVELETALRNFRQSVHGWSEQEFNRTRSVAEVAPRGWWMRMRAPIAVWSLGCALAFTAVTVPVSVHHRHVAEVARQAAAAQEASRRQAEEAARAQQLASAMSDEELLSHVDSDIAQATPKALEPLASLMSDSE